MTRFASPRLVSALQRRTAAGFYGDSALLLIDIPSGAYDGYNNAITTTSEVPLACAFNDKPSLENWRDYGDVQVIEAEIRFAAPAPTKGNRVTVTGRFGSLAYANKTFEIIDIQDRGAMGYVCALKAVAI